MKISKYLSFEFKTRIFLFLEKFKQLELFDGLMSERKKVYIFLAADYGNLGDVAITYAQTKYLQDTLPEYQVVDVPISKTLKGLISVKKYIKKGDIVTTVGGGNLGDLYEQIEFYRQLVVQAFPNNKIVSFPQTIDFSKKESGVNALAKARMTYSKHKNLTFVAREQRSYLEMKESFPDNNVILTPDIVMSLDKTEPELNRRGVVLCLRDDSEKLLNIEQDLVLKEIIDKRFNNQIVYDTHIKRKELSLNRRNEELGKIWGEFKKAELVITDRLHGMIFCYITKTPCLVFLNNNHKILSSFEWIKNTKSIILITEFSKVNIEEAISNLSQNKESANYTSLKPKYSPLSNLLRN